MLLLLVLLLDVCLPLLLLLLCRLPWRQLRLLLALKLNACLQQLLPGRRCSCCCSLLVLPLLLPPLT
jgi:hypothetical protein